LKKKSKKVEKIEPKEPEAPDYIKNSEIYQSIKSSKEKREEIGAGDAPLPPTQNYPPPQKDEKLDISTVDQSEPPVDEKVDSESEKKFKLIEITSEIRARARDLCQIEAREAFATFLLRVQQRFMVEANHSSKAARDRSDQIDLVCRFLTRASANLETPLQLDLPPSTSPVNHRKQKIGGLLVEFIELYNQETSNLIAAGAPVTSGVCSSREKFEFFLKFCSEQAVEDILTTYTQENKSASVFLGAKKKKRKEVEKVNPQPEEEKLEKKEQKPSVYRQRQVSREISNVERRRAISQERPKLLTERVPHSPFERSVRGAAYIYTTKPSERQPSTTTSRQPVQAVPTTANEAIKLALKKLAERSEKHDENQRVSNLAQQLAKINQHAARANNRPSSAVVQRNTKYSSKYRTTVNQDVSKATNQRPSSAHPITSSKKAQVSSHTRVCWR